MRVLHVTNLYPYNDAPTYGIFVKEQIDSLGEEKLQNVFFINARKNGFFEYFRVIRDLKKVMRNYDVIHCHHQFSAISAYLANPKACIITAVLGDIEKRNWINKKVFSIAKRISRKLIIKNKIPSAPGNYVLLPNGVNLDFFKELNKSECRKILELKEDRIYVLFVCNGSLDNPIKRHDKFIDVIKKLNEETDQKKYEPLYLSNVSREQVPVYFNAADFMLLTSDHEGSPNAVKEAMACNLPIVATSVGDVSVLLKGVQNSFISETGNVAELIELCRQVEISKKSTGRKRLLELKIDSESVAKNLKNIYKGLAE